MAFQAPNQQPTQEQTTRDADASRQFQQERRHEDNDRGGFNRRYSREDDDRTNRNQSIGWGQFNAQAGMRATKSGDGEAHKISGYITEVLKKPGAVSKQGVLFFPFVLNGSHNGVPNDRSAAVLAAVHQQTGVCYYAVIFGGATVLEMAKMSREVPMADRSTHDQITERPNTIVEALCFDSPFGRDGDSHLSVLTSKVADLVSDPLNVSVTAHNVGIWIYTPTGTEKNPSVSDESRIDHWLAVLENCVINHLEATRLTAPRNTFSTIRQSERRLTVTVQNGTPDFETTEGVLVAANLRFVVTAGSSSRDYGDGESSRVVIGTVYGRASLTHNSDYYPGSNSRDDERPLRLSLSLNGVDTNIPAPAFTALLVGAVLKSIDEDGGNDVRQATIPLKNESGYREFAALAGAHGIKNFMGQGVVFDDDILSSPGQFLSMVTNRGVDVRVDFDLTDTTWAATMADFFLAAYGTKSASKAASDRVYGGIEAYFGIELDKRYAISEPAGIQYTGSLQVGNQQRSLQSFDLLAGLTCKANMYDVDTPAALDWSNDAPTRLLASQAALIKRQFPTASYISIAFGFRLNDDFMDTLMDALGAAGFSIRNIGTGADMQMGRATHYAHSRFASGRRNGGSRGYNGRNFG